MNSAGGTEVSGSILHCCLHRPFKVGSFNAPIPGMSADILNSVSYTHLRAHET